MRYFAKTFSISIVCCFKTFIICFLDREHRTPPASANHIAVISIHWNHKEKLHGGNPIRVEDCMAMPLLQRLSRRVQNSKQVLSIFLGHTWHRLHDPPHLCERNTVKPLLSGPLLKCQSPFLNVSRFRKFEDLETFCEKESYITYCIILFISLQPPPPPLQPPKSPFLIKFKRNNKKTGHHLRCDFELISRSLL